MAVIIIDCNSSTSWCACNMRRLTCELLKCKAVLGAMCCDRVRLHPTNLMQPLNFSRSRLSQVFCKGVLLPSGLHRSEENFGKFPAGACRDLQADATTSSSSAGTLNNPMPQLLPHLQGHTSPCHNFFFLFICRDMQPHATASSPGSRRGQGSGSSSQDAPVQLGGIVGCMTCLLQRLAYGQSLSAESRGGGRQSNARLLPYLIQLAHYFAGFCSQSDLQVRHFFQ